MTDQLDGWHQLMLPYRLMVPGLGRGYRAPCGAKQAGQFLSDCDLYKLAQAIVF